MSMLAVSALRAWHIVSSSLAWISFNPLPNKAAAGAVAGRHVNPALGRAKNRLAIGMPSRTVRFRSVDLPDTGPSQVLQSRHSFQVCGVTTEGILAEMVNLVLVGDVPHEEKIAPTVRSASVHFSYADAYSKNAVLVTGWSGSGANSSPDPAAGRLNPCFRDQSLLYQGAKIVC